MRRVGVLVVGAALLAACSSVPGPDRPDPTPSPSLGGPATTPPTTPPTTLPTTPPTTPPPAPEAQPTLAIVTHATVPPLALTTRQARRLTGAGQEVDHWRGRPVVRSVRAVERDPAAVGVVSLDDVGPAVRAATVDGVDPVRDDPRAVDVTVVGDVMLVRGVPDAAAALAPFARRLGSADLTVGNLESTLSLDGSPTQGGDSFGATPALLRPLRGAGFDTLSLANNHAGDYGEQALLDTVRTLRRSPVVPFGAGPDLAAASRPAYLESGGVRFAFVGFNAIGETPRATPGRPGALSVRMPPRTGPLVPADLDHVAGVVRAAGREADVVVVLPHWGTQYTHRPEPIQREVSRRLVRAGADLVVGGHPHWVQGIDVVAGVPVLHSLGNFVFDMDFAEETLEGVVLETTWWGDELKALRLVPYRMRTDDFGPRPVADTGSGAGILDDVWSTSTGPFRP